MLLTVALLLVLLSGCYLVALGLTSFVSPERASRFLRGFASTASAHYLELGLRLMVGIAFLLAAPCVLFSAVFVVVGWVLVITTLGLLVLPWRWHCRFARWAVPHAIANLQLVGIASCALGGFILGAVVFGSGASQLVAAI